MDIVAVLTKVTKEQETKLADKDSQIAELQAQQAILAAPLGELDRVFGGKSVASN